MGFLKRGTAEDRRNKKKILPILQYSLYMHVLVGHVIGLWVVVALSCSLEVDIELFFFAGSLAETMCDAERMCLQRFLTT